MKNIFLMIGFVSSTALATPGAVTYTSYLCYSACTFDGFRRAQETCEIAANGLNAGSARPLSLSGNCSQDTGRICGEKSPYCQFNDVVLERNVTVY